ncbi:hypothetical protein HY346_00300 [Candidatus Microgenomates bacterium]|nr:hypothetical protein [Candidatus Microgenomates bacterium]
MADEALPPGLLFETDLLEAGQYHIELDPGFCQWLKDLVDLQLREGSEGDLTDPTYRVLPYYVKGYLNLLVRRSSSLSGTTTLTQEQHYIYAQDHKGTGYLIGRQPERGTLDQVPSGYGSEILRLSLVARLRSQLN